MKVRGHLSLPWHCCGVNHPANQPFCQWCGSSVLTVDRVLINCPLPDQGNIAIVASAYPDAESWQLLLDMATAAKHAFRDRTVTEATDRSDASSHLPAPPAAVSLPSPGQ